MEDIQEYGSYIAFLDNCTARLVAAMSLYIPGPVNGEYKDNVIVYRRLPGVCIACLFNLNLTAVWPNGLFFIPESLQSNH